MDRGERGGCKAQSNVEGINAEQGVLLEVVFIEKKATRSRTNSTFSRYRRVAILSEILTGLLPVGKRAAALRSIFAGDTVQRMHSPWPKRCKVWICGKVFLVPASARIRTRIRIVVGPVKIN
jgi:hypothetical protein